MNLRASAPTFLLAHRRRRNASSALTERAVANLLRPRTGQVQPFTVEPPVEVHRAASPCLVQPVGARGT